MNSLISVIVPSYNAGRYVESCLKSIVNQSYKNLEIICIDDGSTDETLGILDRFAESDQRVKVFVFHNAGRSVARNRGIERSSGDYIVFVDADDELPIDSISTLLEKLQLYPEADAAVGSIKVIYEAHEELKESDDCYYQISQGGCLDVSDQLLNQFHASSCAVLFKRKIIQDECLKYPENLNYEDAYWHWCYFSCCKKIAFCKENVYYYYRRPISVMSQTFEKKEGLAIQHLYIAEAILDFWQQRSSLEKHRETAKLLIENFFWLAVRYCRQYEKSLVAYECSRLLRKYSFYINSDTLLGRVVDGRLDFLYINDGNGVSQQDLSRFIQLKSLLDKLFPVGSYRRRVIYKLARKMYKVLTTMNN